MREDDDFGHYLPLLRRIITLVAVITAIPVVLWAITAAVRTYVSPPKIPTFHQLTATASINAPPTADAKADIGSSPPVIAEAAKPSAPLAATVEAPTTATDARGMSTAPKGPFLGDRAPDSINAPASVPSAGEPELTETSPAIVPEAEPAETSSAIIPNAAPMRTSSAIAPNAAPLGAPAPAASAPPHDGTTNVAVAAQEPAGPNEPPTDATPAMPPAPSAARLMGAVPLPRHRPHIITEAPKTPKLPMTRMASVSPTNVPMPRPRPEAAGPSAPAETESSGPLGFLQNLFH